MTPQQLKNAILQQAIQGKLVEQRAEEDTGQDLFEAIQDEKQQLIKEGKLKKQKALPDITADEIPFEIPDTWKWVRLGEIGDWGSGATPSRTNTEYYGGDIPWLKTGDLTDGYIYDVPEYITRLALEKTSVRLNPKGSILIAMYGATIGKLGILTKAMTTNQACCACIVFPSIYNLYLFYFLLANRTTFIKKGEGGAQPNISKEKIVNTLIPLPPLDEQKRIVEKIEELLLLVERYEKAWARLEELNKKFPLDMQKAILGQAIQGKLVEQRAEEGTGQELFEAIQDEKQKLIEEGKLKKQKVLPEITEEEIPFEIPDTWKWVRLGEIVTKDIKRGKSPKYAIKSNVLVFAQKCNTKKGYIDLTLAKYLDENILYKYPEEEFMQDSDIIINSTGKGTLGRIGLYRSSDNEKSLAIVPDSHVTIIRNTPKNNIKYIFYILKYYQAYLEKLGSGSTNQTELKPKTIIDMVFPLPPLDEQKRIVEKIEELLHLVEKLK